MGLSDPQISIFVTSIRPYLWRKLYKAVQKYANNVNYEIIITSPFDPVKRLPVNVKYVKTGNIKPPQGHQVGIKYAQGKILVCIADDATFWNGGLDELHRRYKENCDQMGSNKVVVIPKLRDRTHNPNPYYPKSRGKNLPISTLNGALFDRDLLKETGGAVDIRFVGVYWDCDLAMRFHEIGVRFFLYDDIWVAEKRDRSYLPTDRKKNRLCATCKGYDSVTLHNFWVRKKTKEDEENSEHIYAYMKTPTFVLVKKRLKPFIGYKDEDLLIKSQGPHEIPGYCKWD